MYRYVHIVPILKCKLQTNKSIHLMTQADHPIFILSFFPSLAGVDYISVVTNITFNNGVSSNVFVVPISNDDIPEADETFEVFLKNIPDSPYNVIFDDPSVAVGTIFDDEIPSEKLT